MHIVGADSSGRRGMKLATEAREGGIVEEIRLENCVRNPQRSPSMFDLVLLETCKAEPNLSLLLNTAVTGAHCRGNRIAGATADRTSTDDRFDITATVFVDATGDGRLGADVGAPFTLGRESRDAYGESLAQETADDRCLGSSLMLQARKHDRPMPFVAPAWARRFTEDQLRLRPHATGGGEGDLGLEYGFWWVEWGGHLDTIKQNEAIRDELLAVVLGVWDHVKNGGDHSADHWALEWFGFVPGKRESRRFIGQHVLSEVDISRSRPFDDAIAYGGWYIDTHPPMGVDAPDEPPCTQHHLPHLYDIPLRACVSRDIANLMFAGRNMSATHVAFASTRVMATCFAVGQGVGTAAAHAVKHDIVPADLAADAAAMHAIQQRLLQDDAYLIGRTNTDTNDRARRASISASSEQAEGAAANVLSGQTRSVHGPDGAPPDRAPEGTHRWMSRPEDGLPASITLRWTEPIAASRVQLIFDTGLHRVLTFSLADAYTRRMHWGEPQPETVRDYWIEAGLGGRFRTIHHEKGNYQRMRRHDLDNEPIDALRITVTATCGIDHARICEVRVWAKS